MKGLMAVGAVFVMAGRLLAQAPAQEDPVERDLGRLRRDLNLTEEQVPKAREILKKQSEDLRTILTDEQKKSYEQGGGRGNRGGNNNQPGGGNTFRGGWYPSTDDMKKELTLTDDQVTKMNAVRDGVREEMRRMFQNRRGPGGGADIQAAMEKLRDETTAKMREVCTDDQKTKFDELIKTYRATQEQPGAGTRGAGGRGGPSIDERVARVMETLKVENATEADAIKGVVKKVIELMDKLDAHQREARTKIDEASRNRELSDEAIGDRIDEVRKGQLDIEKELKTARKDLADIVTNRQELELLRRGILR